MIRIKVFVFNPFMENTYLLYDETGECIIVDPGCYTEEERKALTGFIASEKLVPVALVNTHTHVDHILGNNFIYNTYQIKPLIHQAGEIFLKSAPEHASIFGIEAERMVLPEKYIDEGDEIRFGNSKLEVIYTPGHANGSVCLISHPDKFILSGDVLFQGSIGRTDLPSGNFDLLAESIQQKIYTLPGDYTVYPGHGPETSVEAERNHNPFVNA